MAKDNILRRIRESNAGHAAPSPAEAPAPANPIPARARLDGAAALGQFIAMAEEAAATVARVASPADVPGEIVRYLAGENLPMAVTAAPDPALDDVTWDSQPMLTVTRGVPAPGDQVSVTAALAGIAETGSVLVRADKSAPNLLHFLPETHIIVLRARQMLGGYEQAWRRLAQDGVLPRAATLITGPSRTSDIEKTLQIGIHGPRRLHLVLIDDQTETA